MNLSQEFETLAKGASLQEDAIESIIEQCLSGQLDDAQIAVFLAMMRQKGESTEELKAAARAMQKHAHHLESHEILTDIVGTGGDNKSTFNISTASAFVIAGCGIKVAKHGNRSVSSKSGSADLLELAGIRLDLSDAMIHRCIESCNIAFLYAPHYHPAMKYAAQARKSLGIRTFFNLLGPLLNPARPQNQMIGVYEKKWMPAIAEILLSLGSQQILIVNAEDGMDEISIAAKSHVLENKQGQFKEWELNPKAFGLAHPNIEPICVDSVQQSLALIKQVLHGQKGPARDIVLLNAAGAIYCSLADKSFEKALQMAEESIDSGKALHCFQQLKAISNRHE